MQIRSDLIFFYSKDLIITSLKNSKGMMVLLKTLALRAVD